MRLAGKRVTKEGVIVIIAQQHRTQERNRADARERLFDLIRQAAVKPTPRRPTKVPKAQRKERLEGKKHRSGIKACAAPGRPWTDLDRLRLGIAGAVAPQCLPVAAMRR